MSIVQKAQQQLNEEQEAAVVAYTKRLLRAKSENTDNNERIDKKLAAIESGDYSDVEFNDPRNFVRGQ